MRAEASIEALFVWILFFGKGCFVNHQRLVYAQGRTQYLKNAHLKQHSWNRPSHVSGRPNRRVDNNNITNPYNLEPRKGLPLTCNCSWGTVPGHGMMGKIVGGKAVGISENYPMMVGLQDSVEECMFCGGSILTEYHVLTAAHCVYEEDVAHISLAIGVKDRCREKNNGGQYIQLLKTVYIHEYYDHVDNHNDIAIVMPKQKIVFKSNVGPTCIFTEPSSVINEPILILGWGRIGERYGPSIVLQKVYVNRIETGICKKRLPPGFINDNFNLQLCTYGDSMDACAGDSGGPLFVVDPRVNRLTQVALVSMGEGCARHGVPAVNTALFPYLGWIQWTIERSAKKHFPRQYKRCGMSFCHVTSENG